MFCLIFVANLQENGALPIATNVKITSTHLDGSHNGSGNNYTTGLVAKGDSSLRTIHRNGVTKSVESAHDFSSSVPSSEACQETSAFQQYVPQRDSSLSKPVSLPQNYKKRYQVFNMQLNTYVYLHNQTYVANMSTGFITLLLSYLLPIQR